jgi:hypothetical protein
MRTVKLYVVKWYGKMCHTLEVWHIWRKSINLEEYLTGVYYIVLQAGTEMRTVKL